MINETKVTVEKLVSDGSNWVTYRDRMMWTLRSRGLLEHLTNTTVTATYQAIGTVKNMTPEIRWDYDEGVAMQIITASIPNSVFTSIKGKANTQEVWDALKALYEGRTVMILVNLSQQLQNTRCGEEDNVREHIDKLANLREQIAAMGKSVPENEYASILMGSLPTSYAGMLGSIAASAEMSGVAVSPAVVIKLARDEYDRRNLQSDKAQDEAFAADSQSHKKKPKKGKGRSVQCDNCHKIGHTKDQCWAKGGGNEGGGPKRKDKRNDDKSTAAVAEEPEIEAWAAIDECENVDAVPRVPIVAAELFAGPSELYDSGASRHMSPYRKQFVTYEEIIARPITAANNEVFHAIGMGDLAIQVPNGETSNTVLLRDVLHAPDMSLTVVSIGRIIKAGYIVEFADGHCIIKKG
jgi:hypothetical protein